MVVLEVIVTDGVTSQPLSGATVIVQGTYTFTEYTDASGYALFDGYPVPEVVAIGVSKSGYYPHPIHYEDLRNIMLPHSVSFTLIPLSVPPPVPGVDPYVTHMVMSVEPSDGLMLKPTIYVKCTYEYPLAQGGFSSLPLVNKRVDYYYIRDGVERLMASFYTNAQGLSYVDAAYIPQPVVGTTRFIGVYLGDSTYRGCFAEKAITYKKGTYEATVTANPVTFPVPNDVTMRATIRAVTPSGSVMYPNTGTVVTFRVNGSVVGTAPTNLVGEAEFTTNISAVGTHQITVSVATDTLYTGVTSNPFTVTGGPPDITDKVFSVPIWKNAVIKKSYWDATGRLTRYLTGVSVDKLLRVTVDVSMTWLSGDLVADIDLYANGQLILSEGIGPTYTRMGHEIDKAAIKKGDNLFVLIMSDVQPYTWGAIEYLVNLTVNLYYEPTTTATEPEPKDQTPFNLTTVIAAAAAVGIAVLAASTPSKKAG